MGIEHGHHLVGGSFYIGKPRVGVRQRVGAQPNPPVVAVFVGRHQPNGVRAGLYLVKALRVALLATLKLRKRLAFGNLLIAGGHRIVNNICC